MEPAFPPSLLKYVPNIRCDLSVDPSRLLTLHAKALANTNIHRAEYIRLKAPCANCPFLYDMPTVVGRCSTVASLIDGRLSCENKYLAHRVCLSRSITYRLSTNNPYKVAREMLDTSSISHNRSFAPKHSCFAGLAVKKISCTAFGIGQGIQ